MMDQLTRSYRVLSKWSSILCKILPDKIYDHSSIIIFTSSINKPLLLHIHIGSLIQNITFIIFEFLFKVRPELCLSRLSHQFFMEGKSITNGSHILEMDRVGDFQAFHSIVVPPLLEMHFEGPSTPIAIIATNFAFVLNSKPM